MPYWIKITEGSEISTVSIFVYIVFVLFLVYLPKNNSLFVLLEEYKKEIIKEIINEIKIENLKTTKKLNKIQKLIIQKYG